MYFSVLKELSSLIPPVIMGLWVPYVHHKHPPDPPILPRSLKTPIPSPSLPEKESFSFASRADGRIQNGPDFGRLKSGESSLRTPHNLFAPERSLERRIAFLSQAAWFISSSLSMRKVRSSLRRWQYARRPSKGLP